MASEIRSRYTQELATRGYTSDAAQEMAVNRLEALQQALYQFHQPKGLLGWFSGRNQPAPKSLYFWGGVGRGKTFLMDLFFDSLSIEKKTRLHFHRFMQMVHQRLTSLTDQKNPLQTVVKEFAEDCHVLCLDEFFVSDIGDAMILANLLDAFYEQEVVIVTTSNCVPDNLYTNGLQRSRFLPAIAGIKEHFDVVNVDGGIDYRLRTLEQANLYFHPLNDETQRGIKHLFECLTPDPREQEQDQCLDILGRKINTNRICDDVLWIDFHDLCEGPRSQNDYIEIAKLFHAVVLDQVPCLTGKREDAARRFVNMVDEFYDRGVKLIIGAEQPMDQLYKGTRLSFEFERTLSRLLEMQSQEYLALEHKA